MIRSRFPGRSARFPSLEFSSLVFVAPPALQTVHRTVSMIYQLFRTSVCQWEHSAIADDFTLRWKSAVRETKGWCGAHCQCPVRRMPVSRPLGQGWGCSSMPGGGSVGRSPRSIYESRGFTKISTCTCSLSVGTDPHFTWENQGEQGIAQDHTAGKQHS